MAPISTSQSAPLMRVNSPSFSTSSIQLRKSLPFVVFVCSLLIVGSAFMIILILLRIIKISMQSRYTTIFVRGLESHFRIDVLVNMIRRGQENLSLEYLNLPRLFADTGIRTFNRGARRYIAVVGAIEDQDFARTGDGHQISFRIYADADGV